MFALSRLKAELIEQPLETIVNGGETHPQFSKGSKRLAIGDGFDDHPHPDEDNIHMNEAFGALWLQALFLKLS